jgi:hypothetical protein
MCVKEFVMNLCRMWTTIVEDRSVRLLLVNVSSVELKVNIRSVVYILTIGHRRTDMTSVQGVLCSLFLYFQK